ncbi:MAG: hypothetical protein IT287_06405 [Bdellovibrionaceae bacterium]|nr:hypothetical protein [Pseudobdellovibrionaceae bacterium]
MISTLIISLVFGSTTVKAEEIKTEVPAVVAAIVADKNANDVMPTYSNIDNTAEKSVTFPWGTVFYTSVTHDADHDHSGKPQTHLNIRYTCKSGSRKVIPPKRFEFCGYAKSEVDIKQRAFIIDELTKSPEHKGKTPAEINAIYDAEYNDRIVDPVWNILDKKQDNKTSIEITVRNKEGRFGSCEEKITHLSVPVDCK